MRAVFKRLYEDDGGKYIRKVGQGRYHFIEWIDMDDACGRDNEGNPRYSVNLSEVDIDATSDKTLKSARESCGWEGMGDDEEITAECLYSYGARAPLAEFNGNGLRKLMKMARQRSGELDDPEKHEEAMNRPVNAIGSTAREFAQGDFFSAIDRGCREDKPDAKLVAKIYGIPQEFIDTVKGQPIPSGFAAQIRLGKIEHEDPLAYSMGFLHAMAGDGLEEDRKSLAPAYLEGYKLGVAVKTGGAPMPEWCK